MDPGNEQAESVARESPRSDVVTPTGTWLDETSGQLVDDPVIIVIEYGAPEVEDSNRFRLTNVDLNKLGVIARSRRWTISQALQKSIATTAWLDRQNRLGNTLLVRDQSGYIYEIRLADR